MIAAARYGVQGGPPTLVTNEPPGEGPRGARRRSDAVGSATRASALRDRYSHAPARDAMQTVPNLRDRALPCAGIVLAAILASASALPLPAQSTPAAAEPQQSDLYPPVRHATVVHAFCLPDAIKADLVRKALADLSTADADCRVAYGPVATPARPNKVFVVVEAPAGLDPKALVKALKKGVVSVEPVAWTCFSSADKKLGRGVGGGLPGYSPRDFILNMSGDLRWVEARGGFVEFFFAPGKLTPETLADRFRKLAQPFGVSDVGSVVEESFTWGLRFAAGGAREDADEDAPLDAGLARRVEKACARIDGVKSARVDAAARTLAVTVALADQMRGAPPVTLPSAPGEADADAASGAAQPPRMRFDTNPILDLLEKERLNAVAPTPEEGGSAGPK